MQISSSTDEDYYSSLYSSWYDTSSTSSTSSASSDFVSSFTSTSSTDTDDLFSVDYSDSSSEMTTEELLLEAEEKSQSTFIQMMMGNLDETSDIQEAYTSSYATESTYTDEILDEMLNSMQTDEEGVEGVQGQGQGQGRPPQGQGYGQMDMQSFGSNMSFMQGGSGGQAGGAGMESYKPINSYA